MVEPEWFDIIERPIPDCHGGFDPGIKRRAYTILQSGLRESVGCNHGWSYGRPVVHKTALAPTLHYGDLKRSKCGRDVLRVGPQAAA